MRSQPVRSVASSPPKDIDQVEDSSILVTEMTDPDWVPVMKRVAGIITDYGGRTCHAAIVSRELGIPAIVGTGDGTKDAGKRPGSYSLLRRGRSGAHLCRPAGVRNRGGGSDQRAPDPAPKIMMNIASPAAAFNWWQLPAEGIGLARMEFIIKQPDQNSPHGPGQLRPAQRPGRLEGDPRHDPQLQRQAGIFCR